MVADVSELYNKGYQEGSVSDRALDCWQYISSVLVRHFPLGVEWCDVGCGAGGLLLALEDRGRKAWGIEGSEHAVGLLPSLQICVWDLRSPIPPVIVQSHIVTCFDVAEHVGAAEVLVDSICRLAKSWIVFGAAPPGQDGVGHIDLRPPWEWQRLFAAHGWVLCPVYTEEVKRDLRSQERHNFLWWVEKNLQVYTLVSQHLQPRRDLELSCEHSPEM